MILYIGRVERMNKFEEKRLKRAEYRIQIKGLNYQNGLNDVKVIGCYRKFPQIKISSRVEDLEKNEKISCMRDVPFKTLIANSMRPERVAKFLGTILNASYEEILHDLRFIATEFNMLTLQSKNYRGDCVVAIGNNAFILEVNRTWQDKRNMKYLDTYFDLPLLLNKEDIGPSSITLINLGYFKRENHKDAVEVYPL